jgi:hypothetical protein
MFERYSRDHRVRDTLGTIGQRAAGMRSQHGVAGCIIANGMQVE